MNGKPRDYKEIPPDMHILTLDQTQFFSPEAFGADWSLIQRIESVVLTDLNEQTFICSTTPSAWCIFLYHAVTWKDGAHDDEAVERVEELLLAHPDQDDYYDHADMVRRAKAPEGRTHVVVKVTPEEIAEALEADDPQAALLETQREYYCSNHPI